MPDWLAVCLIVVAGYLFGAVIWRWLDGADAGIPSPQDALDTVFAALSLGLGLTGWLALLLAELGWYSLSRLSLLLLLLTLLAAHQSRRRLLPSSFPFLPSSLFLLPWFLLAAWLFFRPHEYILGGADAGVYVSLGANIDRSGSILIDDPLLARLDPALYSVLLRPLPASEAAPYYWFPGFYVPDQPAGRVIPQFYPLHPIWLAVAAGLGGAPASLLLPGLWGTLGVIALFLLARRWGGGLAALLVLGGMSLNGLQIWFSRYPTTETLTQFLLWTGVWALTVWWQDRSQRTWGVLAGLMWGLLLLTRIDMFFVAALPAFLLFWLWWQRQARRQDAWFFAPFFLLALHAFVHAWWQSRPYFLNTFGLGVRLLERFPILPAAAVLAVFLLLAFSRRYRPAELTSRWRQWQRPFLVSGIILLLLLALYAWFIRPYNEAALRIWDNWFAASQVTMTDGENLRRLGWYLSPVGVWLGVGGACWLLWRWPSRCLEIGTVLFVGLFFSLLYIWRLQNNPVLVYGLRRYVPAVIPFATLAAAMLLSDLSRRRGWRRAAAGGLALLWLAGLVLSGKELALQVDAQGLVEQTAVAAAQMPAASILLFNDPAPVGLGDFIGMPLQYLHGQYAFTLRDLEQLAQPDQAARLRQTIAGWQAAGHAVYWVGDPAWLQQQPLAFQSAQTITLATQTLEGSYDRRPQAILARDWVLNLYLLEPQ
ncbi:MAG: hypothetical protein Fur0021_19280 [Candidatus Promineifilaceae bacterium]